MDKIANAQSHIEGLEIAEMGIQFAVEFRDTYPVHLLSSMMTVGPMQSFVGLAIKNGHLVPGSEVATLREQLATAKRALAGVTDAFLDRHGCFPLDNKAWKAAMTEAYRIVGQPHTADRSTLLS